MTFKTYSEKLDAIHVYIENRWATTPQQLSTKLAINERTILRMISTLKDKGIEISYSKMLKEYVIKK